MVVSLLLDAGADASKLTDSGETVLHLYFKGRSRDVVDALVRHGADVNAVVTSGEHAGATTLLLMVKSMNLHEDVLIKVFEYSPDLQQREENSDSLVHLSSRQSKHLFTNKVLKKLLELGVDVNARNKLGQTPILHCLPAYTQILVNAGTLEQLQTVMKLGVSPKSRNHQRQNALWYVVGTLYFQRRDEVLDCLLDSAQGIDVDEADNSGIRPLHVAASHSDYHVIRLLRVGLAHGT
ncbi:ankyrin [Pleomassaria siparia CBS 279.74]|uniref:Ankyrin n=1 Tax=Pleomassaria siparia CBS 279.74 TaxID=1314801 RepID=A0A6G1JSE6_9PLEO|nr:ankyrin [Pleomassaria siparia CBS 279.74]